jgi:hypothetical protein
LGSMYKQNPTLFAHWKFGITPPMVWMYHWGWIIGAVWRETVTYGSGRDSGGSSLGLLDLC